MNKLIEYAVRVFDDRTEWRLCGKRHREDGPAVENAGGAREWWFEWSDKEFMKKIEEKELTIAELEAMIR